MINSEKDNYLHFFERKEGEVVMTRRLSINAFQEKYLGSIKLEVLDEDINLLSNTQKVAS